MTQTLAISCSEHATVRSQTRAPGAVGHRGRWWISIKLSRSTLDDHRWPVNAAREVRSRCVEKATQARDARASFVPLLVAHTPGLYSRISVARGGHGQL